MNTDADGIAVDQFYTPAMLANLLDVSVRTVRRWHRAGLLVPATQVLHLPYFDYAAIATARQLARWMQQGISVSSIEQQLEEFKQRLGGQELEHRELIANLPLAADGKNLILRHGDFFLESTGQLRIEFGDVAERDDWEIPATIRFDPALGRTAPRHGPALHQTGEMPLGDMIEEAIAAEDEEDFDSAIEWYRASLAAYGPNADVCFQLAELLYRQGELHGARERYFMALELNPDLVEARANLGCVLSECGQTDLAIAAFEGALAQYDDYADVHFHLGRALDEVGNTIQAAEHWTRFLELAPESPWAVEARDRLEQVAPILKL